MILTTVPFVVGDHDMNKSMFTKSIALITILSLTGVSLIVNHSRGKDREMLSSELLHSHINKKGWTKSQLQDPTTVYQASLRLGTSYEATVLALEHERIIDKKTQAGLLNVKPSEIKSDLVGKALVESAIIGDVWHLTEKDDGIVLNVGENDLFLFVFEENPSTGYVWNFDEVVEPEFKILSDSSAPHSENLIGSPVTRRIILETDISFCQRELQLKEQRPWDKEDYVKSFAIQFHIASSQMTC